ncbi:RagB/SusD family nutrient uptake outer membrane protein [Labilibaculum antarcticum]|uniref:RagB/SusD family nutrient uptake outer membrane protein n=1 Tax=Labilibaculum antarcticum TaxID=1717717 RepID=A0A1Y1CG74_9BACT|nr:RagB/SusD family nutrient uptake outer membrane protein [Labilibaculum antarcticum]BAX79324.1 RagB/SusD family nutrient uptake outer membrane protein [Labilibaculum antarcticum]
MKTKFILIILIGLSLAYTSCEDVYTEEPSSFLAPEELNSEGGALALLKGAYGGLQLRSYYQQDFLMQAEVRGEYMLGTGSWADVGRFELIARSVSRINDAWDAMYNAVNRANTVIASVPTLDIDEALKTQYVAEAKALRGLHYFNIVRSWGEVPLRLEPLTSLNGIGLAKSSVSDIYTQVVKDLTDAINSNALPAKFTGSNQGRLGLHAAKAILAHVYLTLGQYAESAAISKSIIDSGDFQLEPDLATIFSPEDNATHSGELLSIIWVREGNSGMRLPSFMHSSATGYSSAGWRTFTGNINSPMVTSLWDEADLRKNFNLYNTPEEVAVLTADRPILFKKYIDENGAGQNAHGNNQSIYRYADVLTMYAWADAMVNASPSTDAYEALNQVRRRGYGVDITTPNASIDYSGLNQDEFMNAVWNERTWEFILEGKRWYDLKLMPTEKAIGIITDAQLNGSFTDTDWLYPIPQQEIDNNDALTEADQNPGY